MNVSINLNLNYPSPREEAPIPSNQERYWSLAQKSVALGLPVFLALGPQIAIVCMVVQASLSLMARSEENSWFPLDKVWTEFKSGVEYWPIVVTVNVVVGTLIWLYGGGVQQIALDLIKKSAQSIYTLAKMLFRVTIFAPVVEEVFFRGFIQEAFKDIQILTMGSADSDLSKKIRVTAQGILFGLAHYHPLQGLNNIGVCLGASLAGLYLGSKKEETNSLTPSMSAHWMVNTTVSSRVIIAGG